MKPCSVSCCSAFLCFFFSWKLRLLCRAKTNKVHCTLNHFELNYDLKIKANFFQNITSTTKNGWIFKLGKLLRLQFIEWFEEKHNEKCWIIGLVTAKRKLERLQFSTSSSFVKIWSACSCEFKAYFWTFWAFYHLLFVLETIGVN